MNALTDYPWSSFGCNALGKANSLIRPHELYLKLGSNPKGRCEIYKELFSSHIESGEFDVIRNATNKSWVLSSSKFKERLEALTARQTQPKGRGGDRKSKKHIESKINRACPH